MKYSIGPMGDEHRQQVIAIYNYFIERTFAAYPRTSVDDSMFDRFLALTHDYPALVVKNQDSRVVGFAFLQAYHPADSFQKTAVATYFILPEHTRKGIGSLILKRLIKGARKRDISVILANISSLNPESIEFHRKNGFIECGRFEGIGIKAGRTFGVVWMQLNIGDVPETI